MKVRGIRGATTAKNNDRESITEATQELLNNIIVKNDIDIDDICFILLSATPDLDKSFPARAVREMGLDKVPLLDVAQMTVENDLERCIRVLVTVNTEKKIDEIKHIYIRGAAKLRPDISLNPID